MAEEKNTNKPESFEEEQYRKFKETFPIDKLKEMDLKTYTDTEKGFSFWIINDIFGRTNYQTYKIYLGIYKYNDKPKFGTIRNTPRNFDNTYAWQYDNDRDRAFSLIKQRIFDIATNAKNYSQNQDRQYLKNIDKIELPPVYKWKIAFLYSGRELIDCYSVDKLKELFQNLLPKEKIPQTISDLQYQLVQIREKNPEEFNAAFASLWEKENNNNEDKTMTDKNTNASVLAKNLAELLTKTKNIILHGAPGTGKTYLAKDIAAYMNFHKKYSELNDKERQQFSEYTGFVQFHPSYDYTDFVEGLRPKKSEDDTVNGFEPRDGIFKKFCENALKSSIGNQKSSNFNDVWNSFLDEIVETNIDDLKTGVRGKKFDVTVNSNGNLYATAKTKTATKMTITKETIRNYLENNQLPKYWKPYITAIGNYIKSKYEIQFSKSVDKNAKFVFIIDEINRGELSKIFGELFFAIDPGYRGAEKCKDLRTQYANMQDKQNIFDETLGITDSDNFGHFFVPDNVYIIGTMNDIDRSVESMDFAMRRRFTFKEITAGKSAEAILTPENLKGVDETIITQLKTRMNHLNEKIVSKEIGLSSGYQIGAAYFLKFADYYDSKDKKTAFDNLWNYNLEPLLKEYLRGQSDVENKLKQLEKAYKNESEQEKNEQDSGTSK